MINFTSVLFYGGAGCLLLGGLLSVVFLCALRSSLLGKIRRLLLAGTCLLAWLAAMRSVAIGHVAAGSAFDAVSLWVMLIGVVYLTIDRKGKMRALAAFVTLQLAVLVMIALASAAGRHASPRLPVVSYWLDLHILTALVGYGIFAIGFLLSLMYLLQERRLKHKILDRFTAWLPSLEELDQLNYLLIGRAFTFFTVALLTGTVLVYREGWQGIWWFEPKILLALLTWALYAVLFHVRGAGLARGRRIAWGTLAGFLLVLTTFFLVEWLVAGTHRYL